MYVQKIHMRQKIERILPRLVGAESERQSHIFISSPGGREEVIIEV